MLGKNASLDSSAISSAREAAMRALKCRHVLILCGGSDEEASVSLAASAKVAGALQALGISHELISPEELLAALHKPNVVVKNILYGPTGEGGAVVGMLAALGVPVTYSGTSSSAITLDKWRTKLVLGSAGVRTTWTLAFDEATWKDAVDEAMARGNWPIVCKPLKLGCSIGVAIARDAKELAQLAGTTATRFGPALLEPFLAGEEFSVAVLQPAHLPAFTLPVLRIAYAGETLANSDIKYGKGEISLECPAKVKPELIEELLNMALTAYQELACSPLARVDFRCDEKGSPYLLEVNHHPGMTPHSWYPLIASHANIDYPTLLLIVLHAAIARAEDPATKRPLLDPEQVGTTRPSDNLTNPIAVSMGTGWTEKVAGGLYRMSPRRLVKTRIPASTKETLMLVDLMYEDERSLDWRAFLDALGYRRIGPSLLSCALVQDKKYQRLAASELDIAQPRWTTLTEWRAHPGLLPSVLKRRTSWQSRHVFLMSPGMKVLPNIEPDQGDDWIVEGYVPGDEYHVGLLFLPHYQILVLPVARIRATTEPWILDESRKERAELIEIEFVSEKHPSVTGLIIQSKRLMEAFDMPPFARVEWRCSAEGTPIFIEFDNCPGLTENSIVTRMLRRESITLADIVRAHIKQTSISARPT